MTRHDFSAVLRAGIVVLLVSNSLHVVQAQFGEAPAGGVAKGEPIGQFLTLGAPLDDAAFGMVSRQALELENRAKQEQRPGILVLEIKPGSSPFHQVQGLAKFLANEVPSLTTVAFVPQTVRGHHAVLALACKEIVLAPDAELGDIGLGKAVDLDDRQFVINLVNKRHNARVSEALAIGMFDPQSELTWVQLEMGDPPRTESRLETPAGIEKLLAARAVVKQRQVVKEAGVPGSFSGEKSRSYGFLVANTADSREEVVKLYKLPREAMREQREVAAAPKAALIKVEGLLDPMQQQFIHRQIERTIATGVNLLVFELDATAGLLGPSADVADAISELSKQNVRTVAYVPQQATSGIVLIAVACDEIYLRPTAKLSDAGRIAEGPGGQLVQGSKTDIAIVKDKLADLARRHERSPAIAGALADNSEPVFRVSHRDRLQVRYMTDAELHESTGDWVKGEALPETGRAELFELDGRRAHELGFASAPVEDHDALKQRLGLPAAMRLEPVQPNWVDKLVFILNRTEMTLLLFMVGILCIYMEAHVPSGFFGICAGLCFGLYFWSRFLGGTAVWLEVILFLLGVGCLALEVFVVPGFGVFGVCGGILVLASLILASQTFVIPHSDSEFHELTRTVGSLGGAILGFVGVAALIGKYLPAMPLFNKLVLIPPGAEELHGDAPHLRPDLMPQQAANPLLERDSTLLGREGVSLTVLRPAGKAQFGDDLVDVVSEGPFITQGRRIEVIEVTGNRVVVREV
jgi:membrane-bound serine protease (ClpP class)